MLHELGKLHECRCHNKRDFIALFLEPVKNDSMDILDGLQLYPEKAEFSDDNIYTITVRGKKKTVWTCAKLWAKGGKQRIFAVYPMKKKDLDTKGGY